MGLILLFAGRSVSKLFKSSGIKGLDGIVNSEAAAKIKPPVTRYPGNRKYIQWRAIQTALLLVYDVK